MPPRGSLSRPASSRRSRVERQPFKPSISLNSRAYFSQPTGSRHRSRARSTHTRGRFKRTPDERNASTSPRPASDSPSQKAHDVVNTTILPGRNQGALDAEDVIERAHQITDILRREERFVVHLN